MHTCKSICPYDCPTSCGLLVETDGARIHKVKGDPADPVCRGLICRKMQRYQDSIHAEHRLLTPLRRTGDKGEGRFAPISWEEAVAAIADHWTRALREEGGESILPFYYSGVMSLIQRNCGDALFNRLGACSLVKTLCASAKHAGYVAVAGATGCLDPRELARSDFYLVWGCNLAATRLQSMPDLVRARRAGKRVVLVESCALDMAGFSDQVVLVAPGTDGALALAGQLAQAPRQALRATKALLNQAILGDLETILEEERQAIVGMVDQPDFAEGIKAFFERRKPNFA